MAENPTPEPIGHSAETDETLCIWFYCFRGSHLFTPDNLHVACIFDCLTLSVQPPPPIHMLVPLTELN
jgi:hypothetical protein